MTDLAVGHIIKDYCHENVNMISARILVKMGANQNGETIHKYVHQNSLNYLLIKMMRHLIRQIMCLVAH